MNILTNSALVTLLVSCLLFVNAENVRAQEVPSQTKQIDANDRLGDKLWKLWDKNFNAPTMTEESLEQWVVDAKALINSDKLEASNRAHYIYACTEYVKMRFYLARAVNGDDRAFVFERMTSTLDPCFNHFTIALKNDYRLTRTSSDNHPYGLQYGFQAYMETLHTFYDGMMDEKQTAEPYVALEKAVQWWKETNFSDYNTWWMDKERNIAAWEERNDKAQESLNRWEKLHKHQKEMIALGAMGPYSGFEDGFQMVRILYEHGTHVQAAKVASEILNSPESKSPGSLLKSGAVWIVQYELFDIGTKLVKAEKEAVTNRAGIEEYMKALESVGLETELSKVKKILIEN